MHEQVIWNPSADELDWYREEATTDLRFVSKDGKPVLQQRHLRTTRNSQSSEWREVPVLDEAP